MRRNIWRTVTSRRACAAVMVVLALACAAGLLLPQSTVQDPAEFARWTAAYPTVAAWQSALGLDDVFGTWWFAAILAYLALGMALSAIDQAKVAWRRTKGTLPGGWRSEIASERPAGGAAVAARRLGYLRMSRPAEPVEAGNATHPVRFARHPWGWWAGTVLHAGMALCLASAAFAGALQASGSVRLVEGETLAPGSAWRLSDHGILGPDVELTAPIVMRDATVAYWPDGQVRRVASGMIVAESADAVETTITANSPLAWRGLTLYQGRTFGDALFIEVMDAQGNNTRELIEVVHPVERRGRTVMGVEVPSLGGQVRILYDPAEWAVSTSTGLPADPLIVLRTESASASSGPVVGASATGAVQATLSIGADAQLAGSRIRLLAIRPFSEVLVTRTPGVEVLFASFFVVFLGSLMLYVTPSAELEIEETASGCTVRWRGSRWAADRGSDATTVAGDQDREA